jgi:Flp pilus assembly protein TadD
MIAILIIGTFSFRTALRGRDYRDWYIAATTDITVSKEQYVAANNLAANYIDLGQNNEAKIYAARSVSVYPCYANYNNLGLALYRLGDYSGAMNAFKQTVKYDSDDNSPYEKVGELTLLTGGFDGNKQFLLGALNKFPRDASLWMYLAILEDKYNDNVGAKIAIQKATRYGKVNETLYNAIINNQPVTINIANTGKSVTIQ